MAKEPIVPKGHYRLKADVPNPGGKGTPDKEYLSRAAVWPAGIVVEIIPTLDQTDIVVFTDGSSANYGGWRGRLEHLEKVEVLADVLDGSHTGAVAVLIALVESGAVSLDAVKAAAATVDELSVPSGLRALYKRNFIRTLL
jgi:hypothetical protein